MLELLQVLTHDIQPKGRQIADGCCRLGLWEFLLAFLAQTTTDAELLFLTMGLRFLKEPGTFTVSYKSKHVE